MSSLIIFVLGAFAGSLVACMVLSECILAGVKGKRKCNEMEGQEGGNSFDHRHYERKGKTSDYHDL